MECIFCKKKIELLEVEELLNSKTEQCFCSNCNIKYVLFYLDDKLINNYAIKLRLAKRP